MMKYIGTAIAWIWDRKLFFGVIFGSAALFTLWLFPFNDLSDAVTSMVARSTNNQVYVQADELHLHVFPQPAISADNVKIETVLPTLEAQWAKVTPSLFSLIFNLPTIMKASSGDQVAARSLGSRLGVSVSAEGLLGGDFELRIGSGKKNEQGQERSRVALALEEVNLKEVQQWAGLPLSLQGRADFHTDMLFTPDFQDQPEGEFELKVAKFSIPAGTVQIPFEGAMLPISLPSLTLANVTFRGRLVGGNLFIEEGIFGQSQDPLYGRIKGQIGLRLIPTGQGLAPQFGQYNLTVDLTTNATVQRELSFLFLPLESAKTPTSDGGGKYLFKMAGQIGAFPSVTRISTF